MSINPLGDGGSIPSGGTEDGKIGGDGGRFKLGSIRAQFNALNQKFVQFKAGGQHDPAAHKQLLGSVEHLLTHPNMDEDTRKALDKMKTEIEEMKLNEPPSSNLSQE